MVIAMMMIDIDDSNYDGHDDMMMMMVARMILIIIDDIKPAKPLKIISQLSSIY